MLNDSTQSVNARAHVQYFEDETQALTLSDILDARYQGRFSPQILSEFAGPTYDKVFWGKLKLTESTDLLSDQSFILSFSILQPQEIDFFLLRDGELISHNASGISQPNTSRALPDSLSFAYPLELARGHEYTSYFRVKGGVFPFAGFPIDVYDETRWLQNNVSGAAIVGAIYGSLLCFFLYHLIIAIYLKVTIYFTFSFWIITAILILCGIDGLGAYAIWPRFNDLNDKILAVATLATLLLNTLLIRGLLDIDKTHHKYYQALMLLLLLYTLALLVSLSWEPYRWAQVWSGTLSTPILALLFGLQITKIRDRYPLAVPVFIAQFFALASAVVLMLASRNIIPLNQLTYFSSHIGHLGSAIMFSMIIGAKIKNSQLESSRIQQQAKTTKTNFLAAISHELRTPIHNAINALISINHQDKDADQEYVQMAKRSSYHMLNMVDRLLLFTEANNNELSVENGNLSIANLEHFAREQYETNWRASDNSFAVQSEIDPGTEIEVDVRKLRTIIYELLDNAFKFTREGSVILLLVLKDDANQKTLELGVIDTGKGFDPETSSEMEKAFLQAEGGFSRTFGGLGIGLSLAATLVKVMGGSLRASATQDRGARFDVQLPVSAHQTISDSQVSDEFRRQVLIAEDNPVNQLFLKKQLEQLGCMVETANDGREAIDLYAKHNFDIIFMDCQMPTMDGFEATRRIRQQDEKIPIVAVTANVMSGDRQRCFDVGMNDFIAKPFTPKDLRVVLSQL